jgi:hypothetical protein
MNKHKNIQKPPLTDWLLNFVDEHETNLTELAVKAGLSATGSPQVWLEQNTSNLVRSSSVAIHCLLFEFIRQNSDSADSQTESPPAARTRTSAQQGLDSPHHARIIPEGGKLFLQNVTSHMLSFLLSLRL